MTAATTPYAEAIRAQNETIHGIVSKSAGTNLQTFKNGASTRASTKDFKLTADAVTEFLTFCPLTFDATSTNKPKALRDAIAARSVLESLSGTNTNQVQDKEKEMQAVKLIAKQSTAPKVRQMFATFQTEHTAETAQLKKEETALLAARLKVEAVIKSLQSKPVPSSFGSWITARTVTVLSGLLVAGSFVASKMI